MKQNLPLAMIVGQIAAAEEDLHVPSLNVAPGQQQYPTLNCTSVTVKTGRCLLNSYVFPELILGVQKCSVTMGRDSNSTCDVLVGKRAKGMYFHSTHTHRDLIFID